METLSLHRMRNYKTGILLLKITWAFLRALVVGLQLLLAFLYDPETPEIGLRIRLYGSILGTLAILLLMIEHIYKTRRLKFFLSLLMVADIVLQLIFSPALYGVPLLIVLCIIVLLMQAGLAWFLFKTRASSLGEMNE